MKAKPKAAIYARYSSKIQNPLSVADQVALCRRLIEREFCVPGGEAAVFSDHELTGATDRRQGLKALLEAAERKEFDVVVAEGLDRVTRSLEDVAAIYARLVYYEVGMHTAHEGRITWLHVGFKGTMNAIYLDDMKDKIRRGQRARAEEGRQPSGRASGRAYGYRVIRGVVDGKNRNVNGLREIDEAQAVVVRRIFKEFVAGKPIKTIARDLNADGLPSPSGAVWRFASIYGKGSNGDGTLRNEIYKGVLVYNRTRRVTDPVTKRSRPKINPESEWIRTPVPHLRIVNERLWNRARTMLSQRGPQAGGESKPKAEPRPASKKRAWHEWNPHNVQPLTGLVRCGRCGGMAHLANLGRYVCADARYTRTCNNTRGKRVPELVRALFPALRKSLSRQRGLFAGVNALVEGARERRAALEKEIAEKNRGIEKLLKVAERGLLTERVFQRMAELEKGLTAAKNAIKTVPGLPASEREVRLALGRALDRMKLDLLEQARAGYLRDALRLVVEKITLTPIADRMYGSTVRIRLKPGGWPDLWRVMTAVYPEITAPPARKAEKR